MNHHTYISIDCTAHNSVVYSSSPHSPSDTPHHVQPDTYYDVDTLHPYISAPIAFEPYFLEKRLLQYSHIHGRDPLCAAMWRSKCSVRPKLWVQIGQAWRLELREWKSCEGEGDKSLMEPVSDMVVFPVMSTEFGAAWYQRLTNPDSTLINHPCGI